MEDNIGYIYRSKHYSWSFRPSYAQDQLSSLKAAFALSVPSHPHLCKVRPSMLSAQSPHCGQVKTELVIPLLQTLQWLPKAYKIPHSLRKENP